MESDASTEIASLPNDYCKTNVFALRREKCSGMLFRIRMRNAQGIDRDLW